VSVIIPTNGSSRTVRGRHRCLVVHAIDSLVARTGYENYELVVLLTPGSPDDLPDRITQTVAVHGSARRPPVRFCRDDRPFNFSQASNLGAAAADGEILVFLNDDTEVQSADWLDHLVGYATRRQVGAVGARLLYEDGTIQHAGIWSRGGFPSHRYVGFPADHPGHLDALRVPQNCLAVSGACLAVERTKFTEAGGFCIDFPSSYNDVDLCLKLAQLGYRTVVVPDAVLTHFEASTRSPTITEAEQQLLNRRWRRLLVADPYDNPNHLAPEADEFPPPRAEVTLAREQAGLVTHHPRIWRSTSVAG
jgi:GT2 family glycosyltransferase